MHLKILSMMNATDLQNNIPMNMAVSIEEIQVYKFLSTLTKNKVIHYICILYFNVTVNVLK